MAERKGLRELLPADAGYQYGNLLPLRRNLKTGQREWAVPAIPRAIINSAWDAFTAPGDVLTGYRKPTPEMMTNFAVNTAGLGALRGAPRVAAAADEALLGQRLSNRVVPEPNPAAKTTMLEGRGLTSPSQVTHAQRNMSHAELEAALKSGRFTVPKEGTKFSSAKSPAKWWSAADETGVFGRPWNRANTVTVRMPIDKLPKNRAASIKHAEIYDSEAKSWVPVRSYAMKYAIGGTVIDDGDPAKRRKLI